MSRMSSVSSVDGLEKLLIGRYLSHNWHTEINRLIQKQKKYPLTADIFKNQFFKKQTPSTAENSESEED